MDRLDETSLECESFDTQDGYQLEVHDVAELLGVTRTRVSQLTSNGQLSYERRRVGSRNRLYYKKSEVLAYQRGFYGRQGTAVAAPEVRLQNIAIEPEGLLESLRRGASRQHTNTSASHTHLEQSPEQLFRLEEQIVESQRLMRKLLDEHARARPSTHPRQSAVERQEQEQEQQLQQKILREIHLLAQLIEKQHDDLISLKQDFHAIRKEIFQIDQTLRRLQANRFLHTQNHREPIQNQDLANASSESTTSVGHKLRKPPRSRQVLKRSILR